MVNSNLKRDDVLNSFWDQYYPTIYPSMQDGLNDSLGSLSALLDSHWDRYIRMANLAASECIPNEAVLAAAGSVVGAQTVEGFLGNRWFPGTEVADECERIIAEHVNDLFGMSLASAQPHSATQANQAVALSALNEGDRVLAFALKSGGHVSHGFGKSLVGRFFEVHSYGLDVHQNKIDYEALQRKIQEIRPKLVISGTSAFPRDIDFKLISRICKKFEAMHLADISHTAGLVAAGEISSAADADFITFSMHKTMLGVRGGIALSSQPNRKFVADAVFPTLQSAVLPNLLVAKAVGFADASKLGFKRVQSRIVENARYLADRLIEAGVDLWTGGTDTHLICIEIPKGSNANSVNNRLFESGIIANVNFLPRDVGEPTGIRMGLTVLTQMGISKSGLDIIAAVIRDCVRPIGSKKISESRDEVQFVIEELILNRRKIG